MLLFLDYASSDQIKHNAKHRLASLLKKRITFLII